MTGTRERYIQRLWHYVAGGLLAVALLVGGGLVFAHPVRASAASCDPVNIVRCGFDTSSLNAEINAFQASYNSGSDSGHNDLKQVYRWSGATDASVAGMNTSNTKSGTLYRNGDIKVDGQIVGHDAWVAARFTQGAGFVQISSDAWARKTTTSFAEASAPVLVHFSGGAADFAVMVNCGNAVKFTPSPPPPPPQPSLICDSLSASQVGDTLQFNFEAHATAAHTSITKYVFDFGDDQSQTVPGSDMTAATSHTYALSQEGSTLHARVTVFSNDFSQGKTSANCTATVVTPPKPTLACLGVVRNSTNAPLTNNFTATARATRTTIRSYTFDYSDGTSKTITTSELAATDIHTFANNNVAYQVAVTIQGTTADGQAISAENCQTSFTTPAPNECKPGVAVGSPECQVQPCQFDSSLSSTDSKCVQPVQAATLINTGPGSMIGAAATVAIGGTAMRYMWLRRRLGL